MLDCCSASFDVRIDDQELFRVDRNGTACSGKPILNTVLRCSLDLRASDPLILRIVPEIGSKFWKNQCHTQRDDFFVLVLSF